MPKGVYDRSKSKRRKKQLPVVHHQFPLDAIPEREKRIVVKASKPSFEAHLLGLCHRMLDQQDRLLDLIPTNKKGKVKA